MSIEDLESIALAMVALCWCGAASASVADQSALAKRYAPVVRLVTQAKDCGHGEPYRPTDVDALERHGVKASVMAVVGHFLMMEDPETFNRLLDETIEDFVGGSGSAG